MVNKSSIEAAIKVDYSSKFVGRINSYFYGIGFENWVGAVNPGLDTQMLAGRSFEEEDVNRDGISDRWRPIGWDTNTARIHRIRLRFCNLMYSSLNNF